jgi:hypothetical protein
LLRIKKKSLFSVLRCEIVNYNLDDPEETHSYQAISYTWGSEEKTHVISLNNCRFEVTSNVYDILTDRSSWVNSPVISIDGICIHQEDKDDKTRQVPLMREIYKHASDVLIWLGNAADAILAHCFILKMRFDLITLGADKILKNLYNDNQRSSTLCDPSLQAFAQILQHPYWERVWIVQEVAAASSLSILYGGIYIDWDMFRLVVLFSPTLREKANQYYCYRKG